MSTDELHEHIYAPYAPSGAPNARPPPSSLNTRHDRQGEQRSGARPGLGWALSLMAGSSCSGSWPRSRWSWRWSTSVPCCAASRWSTPPVWWMRPWKWPSTWAPWSLGRRLPVPSGWPRATPSHPGWPRFQRARAGPGDTGPARPGRSAPAGGSRSAACRAAASAAAGRASPVTGVRLGDRARRGKALPLQGHRHPGPQLAGHVELLAR